MMAAAIISQIYSIFSRVFHPPVVWVEVVPVERGVQGPGGEDAEGQIGGEVVGSVKVKAPAGVVNSTKKRERQEVRIVSFWV